MANEEHLRRLKQGVEAWNQWRAEHPEIPPDLRGADLSRMALSGADLGGAYLNFANLTGAHLAGADLAGANFDAAKIGGTIWGSVDLSQVRGLDAVQHVGPSTIGIDTLYRSNGRIPEVFLRGVGVPEDFIPYVKSLVIRKK